MSQILQNEKKWYVRFNHNSWIRACDYQIQAVETYLDTNNKHQQISYIKNNISITFDAQFNDIVKKNGSIYTSYVTKDNDVEIAFDTPSFFAFSNRVSSI